MPPKTETAPHDETVEPRSLFKRTIASNLSAENPMNSAARRLLTQDYRVSSDFLAESLGVQQKQILEELDHLEMAIIMSQHKAMEEVHGYRDPSSIKEMVDIFSFQNYLDDEEKKKEQGWTAEAELRKKEAERFAHEYDEVRHDPVRKMAKDTELAEEFLLKLGPTNTLRGKNSLDAGVELAELRRLLDRDYDSLPEAKKRPELLMISALITEELALLWSPALLEKINKLPTEKHDLVGTTDDRNVLNDTQIDSLPDPIRWKLIGAELSKEAHEKFQAIADSPNIPVEVKLEAVARSTDMQMREWRIRAMAAPNEDERNKYYSKMTNLALWHEGEMDKIWKNPVARREIRAGLLFELVALAKERVELHHGDMGRKQIIRLALPREDKVHKEIRPITNRTHEKINLSTDIIIEDINGNFAGAFQVKDWTRHAYEQSIKNRPEGNLIYPSQRITMRFLDDYELTRR